MSDGESDRRRAGWLAVAAGLLAFSLSNLAAAAVATALGVTEPDDPNGTELMLVAMAVANLAVVVFALAIPYRAPWRGRFRPLRVVGLYAAFLVVWVPLLFVYPLLLEALGVPHEPQPQLDYFSAFDGDAAAVVALLTVCVLGPVGEEIVFRGFLQTGLRQLIGRAGALVLTSILFGLIHGLEFALPLTIVGLFLGWLRDRSGGMLAPIVAHAIHNSWTVAIVIFAPTLFEQLYEK